MAPLKESSKNVVVHIILTLTLILLLLFSQVTNAYKCWGASDVNFSFENRVYEDNPRYDMKHNKMTVKCYQSYGKGGTETILVGTVKPNPEASLTVCGWWYTYHCKVTLQYSDNRWRQLDIIYPNDGSRDCIADCRWQLLNNSARLYSKTQNKYVEYQYQPLSGFVVNKKKPLSGKKKF